MSRLPILVKLTAAFAAATLLMLAAAALFVYLRLRADIDDRVNANLRSRASAAATALTEGTDIGSVAVEDPEESFAQVLSTVGVLETAGSTVGAAITREEVNAALRRDLVIERAVPGIDGRARILTVSQQSSGGPVVIAIGQSLRDRDEALSSVVTSFIVGGIGALLAASVAGYALARSGLAPVEAMRSRASDISASDDVEGLPLPIAHDQIRRLGETLNDMLRRLRDSYDRERRFVDDASHELRTPLAVIQTDLEGALLAGGHSAEVEAALLSALDETHRLVRVAEDLLVLARAAGGQLPIDRRPVSVPDLLSWTHGRFIGVARGSHRSITITAPPGLVVIADQDRLEQVMTNLIDNALRHGDGDITLAATLANGGVTIEVRDEGDGFPAWFAPRAFDRLTRAHSGNRDSGAGIGLAIVHAIAQAHGGNATIEVGAPTTIRIWLPTDPRS
ncbi:MAG: HAMP domain-containing histidine kinase [Propionibacteriales bacterium]|nr:HAMP domain-containing histidine kinase [Propionibacteriales bacterium]